MSNLATIEKLTVYQLKELFKLILLNDKTLIVIQTCYKCNGKGFYHYYDPALDMQGYYDNDNSPETAKCYGCAKGQIILKFKSQEEVKTWVEERIDYQDWSYNYSEDMSVRHRGYFYQSLIQELLWLLPKEFAETILNKYQDTVDKKYITVRLYNTTMPENYNLLSKYYLCAI